MSGVTRSTIGSELGVGFHTRRRVVETVDIRQQHQQVGTHHGRDACAETVIVAVADFVGGDGVVLVDDRHSLPFAAVGRWSSAH